MTYTVTVGANANTFHDASTGITVTKGEKVELRANQYTSPRIRRALSTGHLILVHDDAPIANLTEEEVIKLDKKTATQYKKGMSIDKIAHNLTMVQARKLAELHEVTVEDDDTVEDIMKAILDED